MRRIDDLDDLDRALDALCALDPRLGAVRARSGAVALRRTPPGFASLAAIVISQQVSVASAAAILARVTRLLDPLSPETLRRADDAVWREAGLSRGKQRTLLAIADAMEAGLDLDAVCGEDAETAMAALTAVKGIGPWTAECYLLIAGGHPDVFPSGDVALQAAVAHALALPARPDARALAALARAWSPHRGAAVRLFWAYYLACMGRDAAPATASAGPPPTAPAS